MSTESPSLYSQYNPVGDNLSCGYPLWKTSLPTWELQAAKSFPLNMPPEPKCALCPRSTPDSRLPRILFAPLLARSVH